MLFLSMSTLPGTIRYYRLGCGDTIKNQFFSTTAPTNTFHSGDKIEMINYIGNILTFISRN